MIETPCGLDTFIQGIDGDPRHVSEYGQAYATVCFVADNGPMVRAQLEARLLTMLAKCRARGGKIIVWRSRPTIERDVYASKLKISARFHCLPAVPFDPEDIKEEGEPAHLVA